MRLTDHLEHPLLHAALTDIGVDDHHIRPSNIETSNTSLVVPPLPAGPGVWDIAVPLDALAVVFSMRSIIVTAEGGAKGGLNGVATRSSTEATTISMSAGWTVPWSPYIAVYSKPAGAMNLSHKMFSSLGDDISLTDAYLTLLNPTTRVLRTQWTNYSAGNRTLNCWVEIQVFG